MYSNEQVMNLSQLIAETVKPRQIILFGSYAYGNPTQKSDVDLMVVMEAETLSFDDRADVYHKIFEEMRKIPIEKWISADIGIICQEDIEARKDDETSAIYDMVRKGKVIYDSTETVSN